MNIIYFRICEIDVNELLFFMYSDSLVYRVHTNDFYKDLIDNPALLGRMDTSNLPVMHPCHVKERKKIPGYFKDEAAGRTMYEFIALRAKSYAYKIEGEEKPGEVVEKLVAKGIRRHVVRNHMTFEDHKRCLFEDDDEDEGDFEELDFGGGEDYEALSRDDEMKRDARLMARSRYDSSECRGQQHHHHRRHFRRRGYLYDDTSSTLCFVHTV